MNTKIIEINDNDDAILLIIIGASFAILWFILGHAWAFWEMARSNILHSS